MTALVEVDNGNGVDSTSRDFSATSPRVVITPCREATEDELPGASAALARNARAAGWEVTATYAAAVLEGDETPTHSTAVRCRHADGRRLVAWWTNGKPDAAAFRLVGMWWTFCGAREAAALVRPVKRRRGYVPGDPFELDAPDDEPEGEP